MFFEDWRANIINKQKFIKRMGLWMLIGTVLTGCSEAAYESFSDFIDEFYFKHFVFKSMTIKT